jgi:hypothetical protein
MPLDSSNKRGITENNTRRSQYLPSDNYISLDISEDTLALLKSSIMRAAVLTVAINIVMPNRNSLKIFGAMFAVNAGYDYMII